MGANTARAESAARERFLSKAHRRWERGSMSGVLAPCARLLLMPLLVMLLRPAEPLAHSAEDAEGATEEEDAADDKERRRRRRRAFPALQLLPVVVDDAAPIRGRAQPAVRAAGLIPAATEAIDLAAAPTAADARRSIEAAGTAAHVGRG